MTSPGDDLLTTEESGEAADPWAVVVGASAGGVESLRAFVSALPADLPAAVLVVLHVPAYGTTALAKILDRSGPLPAESAGPTQRLEAGRILVAPPDHHLVLVDGHAQLTRGPRENGHRPAVDVLFRSAARALGPGVIGVVLSGSLDDGTAGMAAVQRRGGITLIQDPDEASYPSMPLHVAEHVRVDHVGRAAELGTLVGQLTKNPPPRLTADPASSLMSLEVAMGVMDGTAMNQTQRPGVPAGYSCPDCGGTLFQLEEADIVRYRCRVGHAWSAEGLLGEQAMALESALWVALRTLEERAALGRTMAERARERGSARSVERYHQQTHEAVAAADAVRKLITELPRPEDAGHE